MSDMANVLRLHHMSHADWDEHEVAVICHCGAEVVGQDDGEESYLQEEALYATHLAAALSAAGFGPVKEAKAEALEWVADDFGVNLTNMSGPRIRAWLLEHAAKIRATS